MAEEQNFFGWKGSSLILSALCDLPPKSRTHQQILTTVLLCLDTSKKYDRGFLNTCKDEIKSKHWKIDHTLIQHICRRGSHDMKLGLIRSALMEFCTSRQQFKLIYDCAKNSKGDEYTCFVLSDMLIGIRSLPEEVTRKEYDWLLNYLLKHRSIKVRRIAIMNLESIKWPTKPQCSLLVKGLLSSNEVMRLNSINTLNCLVCHSGRIPDAFRHNLIDLKILSALEKLKKLDASFADTIESIKMELV